MSKQYLVPDAGVIVKVFVPFVRVTFEAALTAVYPVAPDEPAIRKYSPQLPPVESVM